MCGNLKDQRRGQNIAEYAVLVGLVVGAAVAMQFYVRTRLQAATEDSARRFQTSAGLAEADIKKLAEETSRVATSDSQTILDMVTSSIGKVKIDSKSETRARLDGVAAD